MHGTQLQDYGFKSRSKYLLNISSPFHFGQSSLVTLKGQNCRKEIMIPQFLKSILREERRETIYDNSVVSWYFYFSGGINRLQCIINHLEAKILKILSKTHISAPFTYSQGTKTDIF